MFLLSIWLGKIIYYLTRIFKVGGGSAAPGYYALKVNPRIIKQLAPQISRSVVITGTNGKTTTSRLLTHFLREDDHTIMYNSTGSNLERGIASTLISQTNWLGRLKQVDVAVWEVDEATLKKVVFNIKPEVIVFLNATRDQLDRYGEVNTVVSEWQDVLSKINWNPLIIVNGDDPNTVKLGNGDLKVQTFGVEGSTVKWESKTLKKGDYEILAKDIKPNGLESTSFRIILDNKNYLVNLSLPGFYHIYDFLAAFLVGYSLNLSISSMINSLGGYKPAFGRVERFDRGYILLIKNPTGATQVLETIQPTLKDDDQLLIALNDNFADGTDVSWIWDTDFEILSKQKLAKVYCSGTRAEDMALRLKYAGASTNNIAVEPDLKKAFTQLRKSTKGNLYILPTYTALLSLQKILTKAGIKKAYWSER